MTQAITKPPPPNLPVFLLVSIYKGVTASCLAACVEFERNPLQEPIWTGLSKRPARGQTFNTQVRGLQPIQNNFLKQWIKPSESVTSKQTIAGKSSMFYAVDTLGTLSAMKLRCSCVAKKIGACPPPTFFSWRTNYVLSSPPLHFFTLYSIFFDKLQFICCMIRET